MSRREAKPAGSELPSPQDLVFAICHEIGNLVTAVQLEADLLDELDSPRGLAASAVKIEDLCGQVGGLLSQVRPLLTAAPSLLPGGIDPQSVVAAAESQLEWRGAGHVEVHCAVEAGLPRVDVDPDSLRDLLLALVAAALGPRTACKQVRVSAQDFEAGVAFRVTDDGVADEALEDWRRAARCGRPLVCSVAETLLLRVGGRVAVRREEGRTCVEFWLPAKS